MAEVVFADPIGSDFQIVSLERLLHLIKTKKERYWNSPSSSGNASLYYYRERWTSEESPDASLDFTMRNKVGFHIYYSKTLDNGTEIDCYAWTGGDFAEIVSINNAGEKSKIPRSLFVGVDQARIIITSFFKSGGRTRKVKWIGSGKVPWGRIEE